MRRIDAIAITFGIFLLGGVAYGVFRLLGFNAINAGVWSQALLVLGMLAWVSTYLLRVSTKKMTYNQQLRDYEEAVVRKKLEEMSPEELAALQAKVEGMDKEETEE